MLHFYVSTLFFLVIGVVLFWRGKIAVRDKYMANSAKSRFFTGVTHIEGKHAVLAGKFSMILGAIVMGVAVIVLIGGVIFSVADALNQRSKFGRNRVAKRDAESAQRSDNNFAGDDSSPTSAGAHDIPGDRTFRSSNRGRSARPERGGTADTRQIEEDMSQLAEKFVDDMGKENEENENEAGQGLEDNAREVFDAVADSLNRNGQLDNEEIAELGNKMMEAVNPTNSDTEPDTEPEAGPEPNTITLGQPSINLPTLSYDKELAIKSHSVGFGLAKNEVIDSPPEGGVIVGLIVGEGGFAKEIVSIQPVYQCGDEYVTGETIGTEDDEGEKSLMIAPPGCVVSGLSVYSTVGIKAIRLGYMKMDERGRLKKNTAEFSEWKGDTGSGKEEFIDGQGKAIVGVYGLFRHEKDLAAMGLFAAKRMEVVEAATGTDVDTKIRDWQSANGKFSVTAEYLEKQGDKVKLRKDDGKEIWVDIEKLCDEDQAWIEEQR